MAVKLVNKETGDTIPGRYAVIKADSVWLYSSTATDKKGNLRGCGKKRVFPKESVTVTADDPAREIKGS